MGDVEDHVYVSPISSSTLRGVSASCGGREEHSSSEVLCEIPNTYSLQQISTVMTAVLNCMHTHTHKLGATFFLA